MKRILVLLMCFNIVLAPTYAFATTLASDGWSVSKALVQGATTTYNGLKNVVLNGKNYTATGTAAITPTASQVGKMIVRTGAVLAVDLAIKAILGSVDYVMDPANNQVKYQVPGKIGVWIVAGETYENMTIEEACKAARSAYLRADGSFCIYGSVLPDGTESLQAKLGYKLVSSTANEEEYLPYDAVASQIISDAVAEKEEAKGYVSSVADTASESDPKRQIIPLSEIIN